MKTKLIEYAIPEWAICPLINSDNSALTSEDEIKLNKFCERVVNRHGNANFMLGDIDREDNLGFKAYNDIDNLGCNCFRLYIRPTNK